VKVPVFAGLGVIATPRRSFRIRFYGLCWRRSVALALVCTAVLAAVPVLVGFHYVYRDRTNLPDLESFARFEFPTVGHVYDANGQSLIALAREYRLITHYEEIPPIVRNAILAAEDSHFFSHDGVDYCRIPRVLGKVRIGTLIARLVSGGWHDEAKGSAIFPQGGSTITQQLVRGYFLRDMVARENSGQLRPGSRLSRVLSAVIGERSVHMVARKLEEIRLSLWLEQTMQERFGSKRRAKEEILARYASFIYMGNGQYGFAAASKYYFGRPLATFTVDDADKAAVLAGIAKSPRDYAPFANEPVKVLRRRNETLDLMRANGFIAPDRMHGAQQRPMQAVVQGNETGLPVAAVVESVLEDLKGRSADLGVESLLQGRTQVYSTVDVRVQRIVNAALEHGLERYESRHPKAKGLIQGAIVVLRNRDASILAETGGRQVFNDRATSYSDFNRVTESLRQPGSTMKPLVYLAAFRAGLFDLDTLVPDEPISVPDGEQRVKWISNYDGQFKGLIPVREALAESRNAVAIWIAEQIGIENVLRTSRNLGVQTPLQPYPTTALGASEVNLLELANAYRAMASGIQAHPYVIRKIVHDSVEVVTDHEHGAAPVNLGDSALSLIQEGLRGVVRMPTGTAHALDSRTFPIAVIGKTGTTNDFRDALFVGSTYGPDGITVAIRIGFDDNRSLGPKETGGRVALPVFRETMLSVYREQLVGPVPVFPARMEQSIDRYLNDSLDAAAAVDAALAAPSASLVAYPISRSTQENMSTGPPQWRALPEETDWLREHATVVEPTPTTSSSQQ
jgi:penicillin-binding protein 1A